MKLKNSFGNAFRRAATFFPAPEVTVECAENRFRPDSFCAVSFEPAIIAVTFDRRATVLPPKEFQVSASIVKLVCSLLESREIGDHVMILAAVKGIDIREGAPPAVNWRKARLRLRLDYPFLETAAAMDSFVSDWRAGVLPAAAWTHAAHVAVTGYYGFDNSPEIVFAAMRQGILHFNTCTGVVNGPDSGYHETLTRFWSNTITGSVRLTAAASRLDAARHAVRIFGEDRDLPSLYYSFDVVRDRRARAGWVPPDLDPLPEWRGK